jgi:H+/Cl- antiporter ClcA/predicted transcriptional regulator
MRPGSGGSAEVNALGSNDGLRDSLNMRQNGHAPGQKTSADLSDLGDFTTTKRLIPIALMAIVVGVVSSFVAFALLRLIGLFTNLFFFQRWDTALVSPAGNHLGIWAMFVPVLGAIVIGLMARYGSERIRGHGIPEAIESILINGSRIDPKVAILKPLSSAISIGSGGPFGAEGPIIMTGGAFGSTFAQFLKLTSAERRTLLVAGAAAGMSATFASPIAAALLAVELLLFEWKPRSLVPVALASAVAAVMRRYIIGLGPLFPVPSHSPFIGPDGMACCVLAGLLAGGLSALLTLFVYASEDTFAKLRIHWMWWPAIGGLVVGIGGLMFPQALSVGYDVIAGLINGHHEIGFLLGILIVKTVIWAVSLGSGTSGGVLAPLLMIGGALGGVLAYAFPDKGAGFWQLVCMGAILGGTMRSPFTATVFVVELTHDINMMLPVFLATTVSHGFTVLAMKRSILTEKLARRGFHLTREYSIDPLEIFFVREVMCTNVTALPARLTITELKGMVEKDHHNRQQRLYPILADDGALAGVLTTSSLDSIVQTKDGNCGEQTLSQHASGQPVVAYMDEPLRTVIYRMAECGLTRFPVLDNKSSKKFVGIVSLADLLKAMQRTIGEERHRERVLRLHMLLPGRAKTVTEALPASASAERG